MSEYKELIIDVSEFQENIDWEQIKQYTPIKGVILRCGYGNNDPSQDDETFTYNAKACERLNIPYGVYLYSYAQNADMIDSECQHILRLVRGRIPTLPIYIDFEHEKDECRAYAKEGSYLAKSIIESAGYKFGVYANLYWWENYLPKNIECSKWVAQYHIECEYKQPYDIWQFTSQGKVTGIEGTVDLNYLYNPNLLSNTTETEGISISWGELETKIGRKIKSISK
mgnify:CR=1 FL=1